MILPLVSNDDIFLMSSSRTVVSDSASHTISEYSSETLTNETIGSSLLRYLRAVVSESKSLVSFTISSSVRTLTLFICT